MLWLCLQAAVTRPLLLGCGVSMEQSRPRFSIAHLMIVKIRLVGVLNDFEAQERGRGLRDTEHVSRRENDIFSMQCCAITAES